MTLYYLTATIPTRMRYNDDVKWNPLGSVLGLVKPNLMDAFIIAMANSCL